MSAVDPNPAIAHTFTGAVLTNVVGSPGPLNVEHLTITGPAAGFRFTIPAPSCNTTGPPVGGFPGLFGIFFNNVSGTATSVTVLNIFQQDTNPSPACIAGHAIRADAATPHTVTVTNPQIKDFQRGGVFSSGEVTMNVVGTAPGLCTIGPGSNVPFSIAQNAVQWANVSTTSSPPVGASGTMTGCTIIGTSYGSSRPANAATDASTAVLLYGARNVTVDHNTIEGSSDFGISVAGASTNSLIAFNAINRPTRPSPDNFGVGVDVTADSTAATKLECNTFDSGWNSNIDGALQISCSLPAGTECEAYSATLTVIGGPPAPAAVSAALKPAATVATVARAAAVTDPPFDWSASGALPPGLGISATTGTISGIPIQPGTFHFTANVTDPSTSPPLTATQAQTIVINANPKCDPEEVGENPAIPETSEPGEAAPVAPITTTGLAFTG
jgi:parallel beta-helix repeat protein